MAELFPRRYCVDKRGRHVLIGLSVEETLEFELLDEPPLSDESGEPISLSSEGAPPTIREKRWLELYIKHDAAWITWAAENVAAPGAPATQ